MAIFGHFPNLKGHVVVEVMLKRSVDLIKVRPYRHPPNSQDGVLQQVGKDRVITLLSADFIGRLLVQCSRQHGLAEVYTVSLLPCLQSLRAELSGLAASAELRRLRVLRQELAGADWAALRRSLPGVR